jgi:hypothetical protein
MRTPAERHRKAGELAEAEHQYDHAAHEYFQAARCYRDERKKPEAQEMKARERHVLSQTPLLAESAREFEAQARKLADYASSVACGSESDSENDAPELYRLAAALFEEGATRYLVLADHAATYSYKGQLLLRAAHNLEQAGVNDAAGRRLSATTPARAFSAGASS